MNMMRVRYCDTGSHGHVHGQEGLGFQFSFFFFLPLPPPFLIWTYLAHVKMDDMTYVVYVALRDRYIHT